MIFGRFLQKIKINEKKTEKQTYNKYYEHRKEATSKTRASYYHTYISKKNEHQLKIVIIGHTYYYTYYKESNHFCWNKWLKVATVFLSEISIFLKHAATFICSLSY